MSTSRVHERGSAGACSEGGPQIDRLVIEALSPEKENAWDAFVASQPSASHYHRAGWARVFRSAFGHGTHYRVARSGGGIEGVLPMVAFSSRLFGRFLVSVPFLNRGGVLASTERARRALLEDARGILKRTRSAFCELRHVEGVDPSLPARTHKVSMSLSLEEGPEGLWKAVGSRVRNLVRKAQRSGLVAREGDPAHDLGSFYEVFARNMRDLGTPVYSQAFFREVFREFPEDVRLIIVEGRGRVAAAGICIANGGFTEMHWAASRRDMLPYAPNMLLYWEAISGAARRGLQEFCFGRSTEGSGPHRFKKQWGAAPTRLRWEYLLGPGAKVPALNPEDARFRWAIRLWKRLPLSWTKLLGPPIVRNLP